jgi:hypothetical protein
LIYLIGILILLLYVFYTNTARCYSVIDKGQRPESPISRGSGRFSHDQDPGLAGSGKEQVMKAFFIMIEHALEEYYESFKN